MIDAATRLVVAVGQPQPGSATTAWLTPPRRRHRAAAGATVLADGGYQGTGVLIPHRARRDRTCPCGRDNAAHRKLRARVEHTFAAMRPFKILRDCRCGHGVYWATTGAAVASHRRPCTAHATRRLTSYETSSGRECSRASRSAGTRLLSAAPGEIAWRSCEASHAESPPVRPVRLPLIAAHPARTAPIDAPVPTSGDDGNTARLLTASSPAYASARQLLSARARSLTSLPLPGAETS